jgi:ABC-type transport system substrate-binding protein
MRRIMGYHHWTRFETKALKKNLMYRILIITVLLASLVAVAIVETHSQSDSQAPVMQEQAKDIQVVFQAGLEALQREEHAQGYALLAPLAREGDSRAQYLIGLLYHRGLYLPKDDAAARLWYGLAAEQGHSGAQNNLGLMLMKGEGGNISLIQAYAWFARAALAGNEKARQNRDDLAQALGPQAMDQAQKLALDWQPGTWEALTEEDGVPPLPEPTAVAAPVPSPKPQTAPDGVLPVPAAPAVSKLRGVLRHEPDQTTPLLQTKDFTLAMNCYDRLVENTTLIDGGSTIAPGLAESWEVDDEGRVYTFHLRRDVVFHNNEPFTAHDVAHTFESLLDPETSSPASGLLIFLKGAKARLEGTPQEEAPLAAPGESKQGIPGIQVLDKHTLQLTLERPYAPFLAALASPELSILPKPSDDPIRAVTHKVCGTGPYKLAQWESGKRIVLQANDNYWRKTPAITEVELEIVNAPMKALTLFQEERIDYLDCGDYPELLPQVMEHPEWQPRLLEHPKGELFFLAFNNALSPFDTLLVRKALQLAVDRKTMVDRFHGAAALVHGILPPGVQCWRSLPGSISRNPAVARELLDQAGFPEGLSFTLSSVKSGQSVDTWSPMIHELEDILIQSLEQAGITVERESLSPAEFQAQLAKGELHAYVGRWQAGLNDPDIFFHTFFSRRGSVLRSTGYDSKPIQIRLERASELPDQTERCAMYHELGRILAQQDAAWLPLLAPQRIVVRGEKLQRIDPPWGDVPLSFATGRLVEPPPTPKKTVPENPS